VVVQNLTEMNFSKKDVTGFMFQYPDTNGSLTNIENFIKSAKDAGVSLNNKDTSKS
jgi:glycine cleavage system pyridoxal-binding protein P